MLNSITVGSTYAHLVSGKFYVVSAAAGDRVSYERDDGKKFELSAQNFKEKFRDLTDDEKAGLESTETVGFIVEPDHRHNLDELVLHSETLRSIRVGLNKITRKAELEAHWGLSKIEPRTSRTILNFYGLPGTGKTLAALSIAASVGKKVYQVDYSQIISKYVGDTAKSIARAFAEAKANDAILFWDEADSMLSRRVDIGGDGNASFATSVNQNRNCLAQELDKFDGIVIMATNNFANFDPMFVRRIAQHVHFPLPDTNMLLELYRWHLPARTLENLGDIDLVNLAVASKGLAGGDVLNVVVNAVSGASLSANVGDWVLTHERLVSEVREVLRTKNNHARRE
jgi:SpoVK/Ycf46/Vps4 family AAA+-type ATPase